MLKTVAVATAVLLAGTAPPSAAPQTPARPSASARTTPALVVLIVVDQFRGDYIQRYGHQWTKGLRRLIDRGAYFPLAGYPYAGTVTCAGHATIGTGAFPRTHGMIGNSWFDRTTKQSTACTADAAAVPVAFGGKAGAEHHGPKMLQITTFADELRVQSAVPARVMSFSLKARSAIGLAGHGGDLVVWQEDTGAWATSSAFAAGSRTSAQRALDRWAEAHDVDRQYGRIWDRSMPAAAYLFADAGAGEAALEGGTITFPHPQTRPGGVADKTFVTNWQHSPFVDEMLADMALTLSAPLGTGPGTDMLAISFSAVDEVGHRFGPASHEVQDVLARLDVQLGKLFDALDRRVGAGRYVVGFAADHGAAPIPEQMTAAGLDAGRYTATSVAETIRAAFRTAAPDVANPVASNTGADVYFTAAALDRLRGDSAARRAVTDAVLAHPAIARAYWADDLVRDAAGGDPVARAESLSFVQGRSADLLLVPKPYWMATASGTTHGTPYFYDQHVPVILMGFGIRPGRYLADATPADIAPTFALLTGVTLPSRDGRVLIEAVRR